MVTVGAVFVLRRKIPDAPRPYRCTGYPWSPFLYIVLAGIWAVNAVKEKPTETTYGMLIVLLGVPFYLYWWLQKRTAAKSRRL
jgi:APA family basic amino acid/polyamine antiporter